MKTAFVDSNVFLRFFTRDDAGQHVHAENLFRKAADGGIQLVTGPPVLFEVAWTLHSSYGHDRNEVLDVLAAIVACRGLRILDADAVVAAIDLARRAGGDFADAYVAVSAHRHCAGEVATFNKADFRKLGATLSSL